MIYCLQENIPSHRAFQFPEGIPREEESQELCREEESDRVYAERRLGSSRADGSQGSFREEWNER